ncbi:hypothetical protein MVEN_01018400 [Mycena venus]|uniref:ARM repeat-containing protein n=1 Tax=Mycena venus TaxID=2733690 RepID=A0A8H7CZY4_9AGAR|nr:hypothetical protein MVEN_01018400 [Mycena venus]
MPPLTRQDTDPSVHSWWSDSNPGLRGPTINLHAASKPLMRWLYYRQATELIKKNHGSALTKTTLQTYSSYFPWDYVSWSTKAAILSELADRTTSEVEARAVVDSPVFECILPVLWSPDAGARSCSCRLLGNLASHECTAPTVLELEASMRLLSLLRDEHSGVIRSSTYALSQIALWPDGAQAIVEAKVLDHVWGLFESPYSDIRKRTCGLVGILALHQSTAAAILKLNPCVQLVSLLRDNDPEVIFRATYTLTQISHSLDGAKAIVDANVLDHVEVLLRSMSPNTLEWSCKLLARLAEHEFIVHAILKLNLCMQLVSLFRHEDPGVIVEAMYALSQIARWPNGAWAIVEAKALNHASSSLQSPSPNVRKEICNLLGRLAGYASTAPKILDLKPCERLVSLLSEDASGAVESATYALSRIAQWHNGAQAILEAKALNHISGLLDSVDTQVRRWACNMLGNLAHYEFTAQSILELEPCERLVSLLCEENHVLVETATYTLSHIVSWSDGAQTTVNAKVLDHVLTLLKSPSPNVRHWTCKIVARLASHPDTALAVVNINPCEHLVSILHDEDPQNILWATYALSQIARWLDGAQDIVDTKALDLLALLESPIPNIRECTCTLVGTLASYQFAGPALLELKLCMRLVSFLHDDNSEAVHAATYALSQIARWSKGAQAVLDAKTLDRVPRLLKSQSSSTREWSCKLVARLADQEYTVRAVLRLNPCLQLVNLLRDEDPEIVVGAINALSQIARLPDGAQAVVDVRALDLLALLKSPTPNVRDCTCTLVGALASHESTGPALIEPRLCMRLVSFLDDDEFETINVATYALSQIARWPNGARAILDAKTLKYVSALLTSLSSSTREWSCQLVARLADHECTVLPILKLNPCFQLVSLLRDGNREVILGAMWALAQIARWSDGADAIVGVKALDLMESLESPNSNVRERTCTLVGTLASHGSASQAILKLKLCVRLVSLLRDDDSEIIHAATYALSQIARWPIGARVILDVKAIEYSPILLESTSPKVRKGACKLLATLALYECTSWAILELQLCARLLRLLHDKDSEVIADAAFALSRIADWVDGAHAIVEAKGLDHVLELLESPNPNVQKWICRLVERLASDEFTASAILESNLSERLEKFSSGSSRTILDELTWYKAKKANRIGSL